MKEVKAYKCDFCSRCFGRKCNAIQHEPTCNNNPLKHHCKTCKYSRIKIIEQIYDYTRETAYCDKYDKPICESPYFDECDNSYEYDGSNHDIPYTCGSYEYKGYAGYKKLGVGL